MTIEATSRTLLFVCHLVANQGAQGVMGQSTSLVLTFVPMIGRAQAMLVMWGEDNGDSSCYLRSCWMTQVEGGTGLPGVAVIILIAVVAEEVGTTMTLMGWIISPQHSHQAIRSNGSGNQSVVGLVISPTLHCLPCPPCSIPNTVRPNSKDEGDIR